MEFDRERFDVIKLPHWALVHWVLNPGLAINELVLGQRLVQVSLIDHTSPAPLVDRTYYPCDTCGAQNAAGLYERRRIGNHAGLVCAACGDKLPTLKNALSWVVLMITWPLWKPLERRFGPGLLARQRAALTADAAIDAPPPKPVSALNMGLMFGCTMGVFFFVQSLVQLSAATPGDWVSAGIGAGLGGTIAGVIFGATMKAVLARGGRSSAPVNDG